MRPSPTPVRARLQLRTPPTLGHRSGQSARGARAAVWPAGLILLFLGLLGGGGCAGARGVAVTPAPGDVAAAGAEGPVAVARAYYVAVDAGLGGANWRPVADLTHPRSLGRARALVLAGLAQPVAPGGPLPLPYRGAPPLGAAARTELFVALGVRDSAALVALDSVTLYERLVGRALPRDIGAMLAGIVGETASDYLGVLPEGDTLAHVVRRVRYVGGPPEDRGTMGIAQYEQGARMDVATLRRAGPGRAGPWRVLAETGFDLRLQLHMRSIETNARMSASMPRVTRVQVTDSVRRARVTPDSVAFDVPVAFANQGRDTAYVTWCRFTLQQRLDRRGPPTRPELAEWGEAHAAACPAGAPGPVAVPPGQRAAATLGVRARRGAGSGPVFVPDSVPGMYRVVIHVTRRAAPGRAGALWPEYLRASLPFRLEAR